MLPDVDIQRGGAVAVSGLFDEEDAVHACASRQEVLGSLEHEIPSQVRQADDVG
jgi:hypothetical protein